jgi:hypothetical protein
MKVPASHPLEGYREIWNHKPALRVVYNDFYDRVATACRPGLTIEIGGGIGNLKETMWSQPTSSRPRGSTVSQMRSGFHSQPARPTTS